MKYMLLREDDNGQGFIIQDEMSIDECNLKLKTVENGHKQHYNIVQYEEKYDTFYNEMIIEYKIKDR